MSSLPPDGGGPPPGVPPQPRWPQVSQAPRETRGVAFFVAIFLGILLIASAGLNVLLFLLSVGSMAGSGLGGGSLDGLYDEVHIAGERDAPRKVLRIPIHGAIAESSNALLGAGGGTVTLVERALRQARSEGVQGLLLDIDSPGGGVTDSDEIYQRIQRFRRDNPNVKVAALFGDMAASGGYYVAVAAERITARRTTITGSIGVIMSAWNFAEAAKKLGIDQIAIKSDRTPFKDILSPTRPMRDEERAMLTGIVDELYDQFVSVVDEGRKNLDRAQVLAAATGAVYTAGQARDLGLIDEIGDLESVREWFVSQLGGDVEIVEMRRRPGLGELLFGGVPGVTAPQPDLAQRLLLNSTGPRFLYFWQGGR
ncbi:MAG: signal peptide peptidase SppA [Planctomycetes bacterium]|nr:signal peptide peptidase SppA [Planctomycetota bacterium]